MCGGFTCSKNALISLNILYILVSFILIIVAAYGKAASYLTSISLIGAIIACGVFLLVLAIIGLMGAMKHHQVTLFFYMVVLFLLFLLQFGLSVAILALDNDYHMELIGRTWNSSSEETQNDVQHWFECCGFESYENSTHPSCVKIPTCCPGDQATSGKCCVSDDKEAYCGCDQCYDKIRESVDRSKRITGGLGLFFCFTELIGIIYTYRFRNLHDPYAQPPKQGLLH